MRRARWQLLSLASLTLAACDGREMPVFELPAHVAGALGVPVWLALAHAADWRWMLDRDDTPWYPTMRLFRQVAPGNWREVFERMAEELASQRGRGHRAARESSRSALTEESSR